MCQLLAFERPWAGRRWLFAHNGDLKNFEPELDDGPQPHGQTDSERAFCWLLQELAAANGPGDRMAVVAMQPLTDDETWRAFAPGLAVAEAQGRALHAWKAGALRARQRRRA
ncbi:MAG: class II glutamine amidotransferase [Rubrivivax sp.]